MTDAKKIKSVSNLGQITENLEQVSAFKLQNKKTDRKLQTIYERFFRNI